MCYRNEATEKSAGFRYEVIVEGNYKCVWGVVTAFQVKRVKEESVSGVWASLV